MIICPDNNIIVNQGKDFKKLYMAKLHIQYILSFKKHTWADQDVMK